MGDFLFYLAAFGFVIALIVLGAWLWRTLLEQGVSLPGGQLFKAAAEKRIGAIETASIDGRRKLVLLRRDGVEHLIMTGGPIDMVIETGIEASAVQNQGAQNSAARSNSDAPSFSGASFKKRFDRSSEQDAASTRFDN